MDPPPGASKRSDARQPNAVGVALMMCLAILASGCRTVRSPGLWGPEPVAGPAVLQPGATAAEVVAAVNRNTLKVRSYSAPNATFAATDKPLMPALRGSLVVERPRRFRLRAGTAFTGSEVDVGSNDELFWLWAKQNEPPGVYFSRHADHGVGAARRVLPVDAAWLVDALGLVTLDPAAVYAGPTVRPDGRLELSQAATGPAGPITRVTVVDPVAAQVVEQHVLGPGAQTLASAAAEDFRFDQATGVWLPRRITITAPSAGLGLRVNTGIVSVNGPIYNAADHWSMPVISGFPAIDLGQAIEQAADGHPQGATRTAMLAGPPGPPRSVYAR